MSVPVYDPQPYLGAWTDWLLAQGYPHDLRAGGWVYLRLDDRLVGRVRARGMVWRDHRPWRTGDGSEQGDEAGPGLAFDVDPTTWEEVEFELGELADRQRQGYRYLITSSDGRTVQHLMTSDPIPDGDWDKPDEQ
ncbi:MAG: hypothetical protein JJU45_08130 [Acidimicrobiia bacterium]|nr:hypothetical protein [Acidimicrobiia bacterium]